MANQRYQLTLTPETAERLQKEGGGLTATHIVKGIERSLLKLDERTPVSQRDQEPKEGTKERNARIAAEQKELATTLKWRSQMVIELEQHDNFGRFGQSERPELVGADPHEYFTDEELATFHATYLELTAAHRESHRQANENTRRHAYNQAHGIVTTLRTAVLSAAALKQLGMSEAPVDWTDEQITEYNAFVLLSPSEQLRVINGGDDEN